MKILLIEDETVSIAGAKEQFIGHDITIVPNVAELLDLAGLGGIEGVVKEFDLVLTDMNIPFGLYREGRIKFDVFARVSSDTFQPVGLIIKIVCDRLGIPCVLITDANGHKDVMGLILEMSRMSGVFTRPQWLNDLKGNKPWKPMVYVTFPDLRKSL